MQTNNTLTITIKKDLVVNGVVLVEGTSYNEYDYTKPKLKAQKDCLKKMLGSQGVTLEMLGKSESLPQSVYSNEVKLKDAITAFINN
jgi:N-dimethylarginine dimethylaminohydrolase